MPSRTSVRTMTELHVLGGGRGESLILRLPDDTWGVIDCCASHPTRAESNGTWRFLQERGVTELAFLCLTHPHADHYRGMLLLLQRLRVHRFWMFPDAINLTALLRFLHEHGLSSAHRAADARDLEDILRRVRDLRRESGLKVRFLQLGQRLPSESATIEALTPDGNNLLTFYDALQGFLQSELPAPPPHFDRNRLSGALRVAVAGKTWILGADATTPLWEAALSEYPPEHFAADIVKVSHHGSENAGGEVLWEAFARPVSVITPYRAQRLPRPERVRFFQERSQRTLVTSWPGSEPASTLSHLPLETQLDLQRDPNFIALRRPRVIDRWSFTVNDSVSITPHGAAWEALS
jgi:beta-lactamase superfamily II metal-dependent hydrolase